LNIKDENIWTIYPGQALPDPSGIFDPRRASSEAPVLAPFGDYTWR
jgi:hypothetical protein